MFLLSCRYCKLTYESDFKHTNFPTCPRCGQQYLQKLASYPDVEENKETEETSVEGR